MTIAIAETTHLRGTRSGLRGLGEGNAVADTISTITTGSVNLFESIFGQKANREAQAAQVALAQAKAAQLAAQAEAKQGLYTALPYVAGGVLMLGILAFAIKR